MIARTYHRARAIYVVGNVAFVADPTTRGAWRKTHAAVAFVACPTCRAAVGQLCEATFGFCRGSTHGARRRAARGSFPTATTVVARPGASPSIPEGPLP